MRGRIAALPMYDWPERHAEVDAQWAAIRDWLHAAGVDAPVALTRDTGDLLDFWKRPDILFAQTCWGPMEQGLAEHVVVVGQDNYDGIEGGAGQSYSSAIVMRRNQVGAFDSLSAIDQPPPLTPPLKGEGGATVAESPSPLRGGVRGGGLDQINAHDLASHFPVRILRNTRLAYNVPDSMSGIMGLARDLEALGESLDIFSARIETGGHRGSIRAVARGEADVAAIDCKSWRLAGLHEPAAQDLEVVGWTSMRKGLPFITSRTTPPVVVAALRQVLGALGL